MRTRGKRIAIVCAVSVAWWTFVYLLPAVFDWPMGGQDWNPVPGPPRDTALLLGALMLVPGTALAVLLLVRARAVLIGVVITLATAIPMMTAMLLDDSWCLYGVYADNCHGMTMLTFLSYGPPLLGTVLFGMLFGSRRGLRLSSIVSAALVVVVITSYIWLPDAAASSPFDGDGFSLYAAWPFASLVSIVLLAVPAGVGAAIGRTWSNYAGAAEHPAEP